jgi:sirohydrochlorin cobaltochelatase
MVRLLTVRYGQSVTLLGMKMPVDALLLFCHGARANTWRVPFDNLLARTRQETTLPVELAFLEFMEPDFACAIERLHLTGARRIRVVLLFLSEGGHTRRDVTALVEQSQLAWPDLHIEVSETMLASESFLRATATWILQA